jgi:hypothetical protein
MAGRLLGDGLQNLCSSVFIYGCPVVLAPAARQFDNVTDKIEKPGKLLEITTVRLS